MLRACGKSDEPARAALKFVLIRCCRNVWIPGAVKNDFELQRWIYDRHHVLIEQMRDIMPPNSTWSCVLQLQPISLPMIAAGKGTNALGLEEEVAAGRGPGIMTSASIGTTSKELEELCAPLLYQFQRDVDEYAASLDAKWAWRYLNYADLTYDAIAAYGDKSVARMRAVSAAYDPEGVFQKLRKSGFKIPSQ